MEISEMLTAIKAKADEIANEKKTEHDRIEEEARGNLQKIYSQCDEIRKLEKVVDSLYDAHLVKKDYWGDDHSCLLTNGIEHNLGFVGNTFFHGYGLGCGACCHRSRRA